MRRFSTMSIVCLLTAAFASISAYGQGLNPDDVRGKPKKQIRKKRVEVLQSRFFKKALRPELGLMIGSHLDEPYVNSSYFGGRLGFFLTETIGFEAQYSKSSIKDSEELKALTNELVVISGCNNRALPAACGANAKVEVPEINRINSVIDANVVYAPFYGKISMSDLMTIYSDTYFTLGYAQMDTDQGKKSAITVGAGLRFYLFNSMSIRVDARDRIFTESRRGKDSRRNAWGVDFGLSYFFL